MSARTQRFEHCECAETCTEAPFESPALSRRPHWGMSGSRVVARQDTCPVPPAPAVTETGTEANPLMRWPSSTLLRGRVFIS